MALLRPSLFIVCRDLPSLEHLGLACKEIDVHLVKQLELLPSFDFHFSEVKDSTMDELTACKGVKVSDMITEEWRYINICKAATYQIRKVFAFDPHDDYSVCLPWYDEEETWYSPLDRLSMSLTE